MRSAWAAEQARSKLISAVQGKKQAAQGCVGKYCVLDVSCTIHLPFTRVSKSCCWQFVSHFLDG